jgi:hypothetical protein
MRRRNPFGAAVFAFSGAPAARFDAAVVVWTGEGDVVDVGLAVVGPVAYRVMNLAVGAATVQPGRVQPRSLA